jgi:alpha,alpha-trehalase
MVKVYYEYTQDEELLARAIPILDKEYQFWQSNTSVQVQDPKTGQTYNLNHYNVLNTSPRPESYYEDYQTVQNGTGYNQTQIESLYADLATGAETGWDYCARWTRNKEAASDDPNSYKLLRTLNTRNVVPIDLNSLLWSMESNLAEWHAGQKAKRGDENSGNLSQWYQRKAKERLNAIEALMWNDENNSFYDYNLSSNAQNVDFTPASYYPFW